jgi:putative serine protease PepD
VIGPRHLWSGDWREDSDARERATRERAERERAQRSAQDPAAATTVEAPRPVRRARRWRLAGVATVIAAAVAAGAFLVGTEIGRQPAPDPLPAVASSPIQPRQGQTRAGAVYARASSAVVSIRAGSGSGTGFLVDRHGTLVTNEHVVGTAKHVLVRFGSDGRSLDGTVRGADASSDLAVVHIDPADAPANAQPLQFADSRQVHVGDTAIAIGNPFGLDRTATEGIVSSIGRQIRAPNGFQIDEVIQTDAAINPGNSGGPLLDDGGNVIGVTSQIATGGAGRGNVGIGFAIPSNTVRQEVPRLGQGQAPDRAWLGVQTTQAPGAGLGAQIGSTVNGGPAQRAGLRTGDVVTEIDGRPIRDSSSLSTVVNAKRPGDHIRLRVQRGGRDMTIDVELRKRPASVP